MPHYNKRFNAGNLSDLRAHRHPAIISSKAALSAGYFNQKAGIGLGKEDKVVAVYRFAEGHIFKIDGTPIPPAKAISAAATPSPPSLKSWQAFTRPFRCSA